MWDSDNDFDCHVGLKIDLDYQDREILGWMEQVIKTPYHKEWVAIAAFTCSRWNLCK